LPKNFNAFALTVNRVKEEFPEAIDEMLIKDAKELDFTVDELLQLEPTYVAQQIAKAAATLRTLYRTVRDDKPENHIPPPSKYFAALMMDGDHMGAFFGKATEKEAQGLSNRMSEFARAEAKRIVESHFGRLVYAGGDDALALLPLEESLPCARELQEAFKQAVSKVQTSLQRPTPSIGIAIAHHTQSLDATLSAMRQAERDAKNRYGRDALCVYVLKRSGEEVHVGTHWTHRLPDESCDVDAVRVVEDLVGFFRCQLLSMKFTHMFIDEARFLPMAAIPAELARLAKRQSGAKFKEEHETVINDWLKRASALAKAISAEEFARWALLARFIASGGRGEE
jgi:CRISPR-associated protein Cmr2